VSRQIWSAHTSSSALARARLAAGLTQQQLADKAHVHQVSVSKAERGRRIMFPTAEAIATALGYTVAELWPTLARAVKAGRLLDTVIPAKQAITPNVAMKRRGLRLAYSVDSTRVKHRHRPPICCGAQWCRCAVLDDPETYPIFGDPNLIEFVASGGV